MKAMYSLDQSVNIHTAPSAWRDKCKPVLNAAGEVVDWIIPKGAVIEGDEALLRVKTGQAVPVDEECSAACGMTPAQLEANQRQYLAATKGIKGAKDIELFMGGIIDGYDPSTTDEKTVYIHGPNWDAWQKAKADMRAEKGDI